MNTITLWLSYVHPRGPSNASPSQFGLGRTKQEASASARHWNNQAPYERFKRVTLIDGEAKHQNLIATDWGVAEHTNAVEALAHFEAGRYASAWIALHPAARATP